MVFAHPHGRGAIPSTAGTKQDSTVQVLDLQSPPADRLSVAAPNSIGADVNGRKPTREEQRWLDLCAQIPCIVCSEFHGEPDTPAEIHHIDGQRKPNAHWLVLSLCARHHRHKDNHGRWASRHGDGRAAFERRYAPEFDLLAIQRRKAAELTANIV